MPANPNLVPTVITDVNGVIKTVHRKPTTNISLGRTFPSPTIKQRVEPVTTPLELPPLLSDDEVKALVNELAALPYGWDRLAPEMHDWVGAQGFAIIKDSLDKGDMDTDAVKQVVQFARMNGMVRTETQNMLLISSRFHVSEDMSKHQFNHALTTTIHSLSYNKGTRDAYVTSIRTEEELAGCVAATTFVMLRYDTLNRSSDNILKTVRSNRRHRSPIELAVISNKYLDELIRERPQDCSRISDYVDKWGMHPSNKGPIKALREFLDADTAAALDDGWL